MLATGNGHRWALDLAPILLSEGLTDE